MPRGEPAREEPARPRPEVSGQGKLASPTSSQTPPAPASLPEKRGFLGKAYPGTRVPPWAPRVMPRRGGGKPWSS